MQKSTEIVLVSPKYPLMAVDLSPGFHPRPGN